MKTHHGHPNPAETEPNLTPQPIDSDAELEQLEGVITKGLTTYIEVGEALERIRCSKAYKTLRNFNTFEAYVKERFQLSKGRAYAVISAAKTALKVQELTGQAPKTAKEAEDIGKAIKGMPVELANSLIKAAVGDNLKLARSFARISKQAAKDITNAKCGVVINDLLNKTKDYADPAFDEVCNISFANSCDLLSQQTAIDLIFVDPIWQNSDDIANFIRLASQKTKILAIMAGNCNYHETYEQVKQAFTVVRDMVYLTPDVSYRIDGLNISSGYKPIIVASQDKNVAFHNVVKSPAADHDLHPYGLNPDGVAAVIEQLSQPNDLVGDFYCGGGSAALACIKTGRRFIGCDNGKVIDFLDNYANPNMTWAEVAQARAKQAWQAEGKAAWEESQQEPLLKAA